MLKELSGMDQDEGMALANYWNSLDDTQLTALANNWQKYNDSLQNLGETLYSDEIDTALTEYKTKVKENLNGLPEDCVDVGVNCFFRSACMIMHMTRAARRSKDFHKMKIHIIS